ncbi:hypothetical protein Dsin_012098 [Dipteronia sinensis]|uniref:Uncharacterized protein n=1 Tax=Dipteronia sinensis TaxID=43782 RepID=A0AAE0AHD8_9ROSI|nr:hypothetical protein Dsin_012098 [Dipteronia sinensis]
MSVTAGVSDTIIAIRDKLRGKIGQTKVKRYWPGKAPEWADDIDEDNDIRMGRAAALEKAFPSQEDSDVVKKDDPRLRRLAQSRIDNRDEIRAYHRRIQQAAIVSTEEEEKKRQEGLDLEEEDEDALEERRRSCFRGSKKKQLSYRKKRKRQLKKRRKWNLSMRLTQKKNKLVLQVEARVCTKVRERYNS